MDNMTLALLDKGILTIASKIEESVYNTICDEIAYLESRGSPDIEVRIYSIGGDARIGLCIYDVLKKYTGKVTGIVYRTAQSMAAIILQACDVRICLPHARILIHSIRTDGITFDELQSEKALRREIAYSKGLQKACIAILKKSTSQKKKAIRKQLKKDRLMSAKQALEFGLVDEIWATN